MTASIIFKKFIFEPIKKAAKWYFEQTKGNYVCMTGTFPIEYYEYLFEERRKRKEEEEKKK